MSGNTLRASLTLFRDVAQSACCRYDPTLIVAPTGVSALRDPRNLLRFLQHLLFVLDLIPPSTLNDKNTRQPDKGSVLSRAAQPIATLAA